MDGAYDPLRDKLTMLSDRWRDTGERLLRLHTGIEHTPDVGSLADELMAVGCELCEAADQVRALLAADRSQHQRHASE